MANDMPGFADPNGASQLTSSLVAAVGANTANSSGTTLTAGSAHAKGSWVVLSSGIPIESSLIEITLLNGAATQYLVDIAIGAPGSEVTIIPNLFYRNTDASAISVSFPIAVPRGTPISARCQSATGSATVDVLCHISTFSPYKNKYSGVVDIGTVTSGATDLTGAGVGGAANTLSAWSAFSASATRQIDLAVFCVDTGVSGNSVLFDYAAGSGDDYAAKLQKMAARCGSSTNTVAYSTLLPFYVPQGSKLFWRFQNNTTASNYAITAIYGLYR